MGDYGSGKPFFNSIAQNEFHTLVIRSSWLVFMEVTQGPFKKDDTVFGDWGPLEANTALVKEYINSLNCSIKLWSRQP